MRDEPEPTSAPGNHPRDLIALTKPRITLMVLLTSAAGYFLASGGQPDPAAMLIAMIGIGLVAGGTSGLNQVIERDVDARMQRTRLRPIPAGRVTVRVATGFTALLAIAGVVYLELFVNRLTAFLAVASIVSYVFVYTPLKQRSSLSTLVGAIPGALPIMGGWTAAHGDLGPGAWALFGLLFFWQLPHFLALAWLFRDDYRRGGLKMLGVQDPEARQPRAQAVLYAAALLPASLLPVAIGLSNGFYGVAALLMGAAYLVAAVRFFGHADIRSARRLFRTSLLYLPVVLLALSLDRGTYPGAPVPTDAVTAEATAPAPS
ncbi:MAG: heme o synthase [Gemmatimonadota bacterium]|nr:heme o synthase [Gemmatimonadota bacterium]MDH3427080.1 heme o synthase [Gemmatimonadota bacterium]